MAELNFILPNLNNMTPTWDGSQFVLGNERFSVLQYSTNCAGWNDELTFFHEESVGHTHPIDIASRGLATKMLHKYLRHIKQPNILEIGCSSGYLLKDIKNKMSRALVIGADVVSQPLFNLAKEIPQTPLLQFDLLKCPLPDKCMDAIVMLNVLEHIESDQQALSQAYRILKPGGILVIEVPAGPHLYDIYDKQLKHFRRYSSHGLEKKVNDAGFNILKSSHLGFFLYPPFAYLKNKNKKLKDISVQEIEKIVEENIKSTRQNFLLRFLLNLEAFLYDFVDFPIGIRCSMVCKKT